MVGRTCLHATSATALAMKSGTAHTGAHTLRPGSVGCGTSSSTRPWRAGMAAKRLFSISGFASTCRRARHQQLHTALGAVRPAGGQGSRAAGL